MNSDLFKSLLKPYWESKTTQDFDEAASQIANAYHLSNVGDTRTFFGATLISANTDILKTFISIGLNVNFMLKSDILNKPITEYIPTDVVIGKILETIKGELTSLGLGDIQNLPVNDLKQFALLIGIQTPKANTSEELVDEIKVKLESLEPSELSDTPTNNLVNFAKNVLGINDIPGIGSIDDVKSAIETVTNNLGFRLMATGVCLYWITAKFSPMPPMPPMISPLNGVNVLFPGLPTSLGESIQNAFSKTEIDDILTDLLNAFTEHLLTIGGIYSGYIAAGTVLVPMVLPWISLIGTPPSLADILSDLVGLSFDVILEKLKSELNKLLPEELSDFIVSGLRELPEETVKIFSEGFDIPPLPTVDEIIDAISEKIKQIDINDVISLTIDIIKSLNPDNLSVSGLISFIKAGLDKVNGKKLENNSKDTSNDNIGGTDNANDKIKGIGTIGIE